MRHHTQFMRHDIQQFLHMSVFYIQSSSASFTCEELISRIKHLSLENILQTYFCTQRRLRLIRDSRLGEHLPWRPFPRNGAPRERISSIISRASLLHQCMTS